MKQVSNRKLICLLNTYILVSKANDLDKHKKKLNCKPK